MQSWAKLESPQVEPGRGYFYGTPRGTPGMVQGWEAQGLRAVGAQKAAAFQPQPPQPSSPATQPPVTVCLPPGLWAPQGRGPASLPWTHHHQVFPNPVSGNKVWPQPRPRRNYSIKPWSTRMVVDLGAERDQRKEDQGLPGGGVEKTVLQGRYLS